MNDHYTAWQMLQAALRLDLIEAYIAREITLAELAQSAELSPRQCIRLVKRYRESGPSGLLSRRQGKPGNHQLKADIKAQALKFIRSRGRDMNPSAIWRILTTEYGLREPTAIDDMCRQHPDVKNAISKETVRKMMIAEKT
ncbi:helix-turn-helix domain-containing protein [Salmonella enterica]|nr:helix-turn-helix domain-containing protein [Salmonella enterica]ECU0035105.1 helix-turn-helix domain-containing protein [Salmonella enterica subsp. enterica serovar Eastbourne]EAR7815423.1 helix-turn-helix domain-containing protein [Salmonella enterica]EDH3357115.1 helix-turn-helix domain-containing protein [Salmonella enterica]EDH3397799.1 helix-turn-helix domain-containing protein [Salmonella enterica]